MKVIYYGTTAFLFTLYGALKYAWGTNLSPYLLLGLTFCALLGAIFIKKGALRTTAWISFCLLLGLLSPWRAELGTDERLQPYFSKEVVVTGRIEPLSIRQKADYMSMLVQCQQLQQGNELIGYKGRIRVALTTKDMEKFKNVGRVIIKGRLEKMVGFRNPGGFDSALYNRINNIGGRLSRARIIETKQDDLTMLAWQYWQDKIAWWNVELRQRLKASMGEGVGALLGSMLLGGSSDLEEELREIFTANGLSHLLSVSGTHLVLLAGMLGLLLGGLPPSLRKGMTVVVITLYAMLCGLRPPIVRALLMSMVLLLGRSDGDKQTKAGRNHGYEQTERGYLLCLVALVALAFKPLWLLDIGFQLSFGASAGLIWLLPACKRLLPQSWPELLVEGLAITMAAQLATLPMLVANFHQVSLIALVSNLLLVPVLEVAVLLSVIGTCLLGLPIAFLAVIGQNLTEITVFLVNQLVVQGRWLGNLPFSQLVIGSLPAWCAVLYYAALLVWADVPAFQFWRNRERQLLLGVAVSLLVGGFLWQQYRPQGLQAYFLDVGQGDCVVLTTPEQKVIVYDTGGLQNLDTGKRIVAPFLRWLGKGKVDALVLSHFDFDHVGGAVGLLQQLQVREIVLPKEAFDEASLALYGGITKAALACGTQIKQARQGEQWLLGDGTVLNIFVPADLINGSVNAREHVEQVSGNAASTVAALHSPQGKLLLTGDLGSEEEALLNLGHYDVFKAGHHGSRNSNSEELLQKLQPQFVVISCGKNNSYGHPHRETLERIAEVGSRVLRTDELGCIRVSFDETGIKCYSYMYDRFMAVE